VKGLTSLTFFVICCVSLVSAQDFSIKKHVISNGGGISINAGYKLEGTIGQHITQQSQGGGFSVKSGFWHSNIPLPELIFTNSFE